MLFTGDWNVLYLEASVRNVMRLFFKMEANIISIAILAMVSCSQAQGNSWFQTNGPFGATVGSIVIDSSGNLFAGTDGGVYRSTDDGNSWMIIGLADITATSLAVDKSGNIFAAQGINTGTVGTTSGPCHGVFKSSDQGESWRLVGLADTTGQLGMLYGVTTCLAISRNGSLYADTQYSDSGAVGDILFCSSDGGDTWEQGGLKSASAGFGNVSAISFLGRDTILIAEEFYGVLRSTDNGKNWSAVHSGRTYCMAVDSSGGILIGSDNGVLVSTDGGAIWSTSGLDPYPIYSLSVAPSGKIFAGALSTNSALRVYSSTDKGGTWDSTGLDRNALCFAIDRAGNIFAGCLSDGIFRSTDSGNAWAGASVGLVNSTVNSFAFESDGTILAGVGADGAGVWKTSDKGANWQHLAFTDTASTVTVDNAGKIFDCTPYGLYLSTDGGEGWKEILAEPSGVDCVASDSSGTLFVGTPGILRSTDGGSTWTSLIGSGYYRSIVACPDSSLVAAAMGGITRSTDHGDSWTAVFPYDEFNCLLLDQQGNLFAGSNDEGVFRSTDYGVTWTSASNGLGSPEVKSLAVNSKGYLFAGTWYGGVFISTDKGNDWTAFNSGLNCLYVQHVGIDLDGYLYAGTLGHGVFRTSQSTPVNSQLENTPGNYNLMQNFPNPFNPTTVISYQLPTLSHVTLKIYDILGREVATLVDESQIAGTHEVVFNGKDLPSGVYFYKLTAGALAQMKKMVLIK